MRLLTLAALAALADVLSPALAASSDASKPKAPRPCTVRSPTTDRFFDLNPIWAVLPDKDAKKKSKSEFIEKEESWHSRGYDYGSNFTLNFCGPVVEKLEDVVGVEPSEWKNISAFYKKDGKTYSIGNENGELVFRGRKLVLNYTNGSPCGGPPPKGSFGNTLRDDDGKPPPPPRRKSTIISLLCEMDPLAATAAVSFVAASEDECTYFFEARTHAACGTIEKEAQTLGPSGVFSVIFLIAILAYLLGGCMYQRTVMHQRGWRQLPNYSVWAGIWGFIRDMFIIATSSCTRLCPSRRGYSRVSANGYGRPRSNHSDDENRLIDQLDEEWED